MESSHILIELRNSLGVCSCTHGHGEEKVNQNIEVKTSTIFLVMRVFFNEYLLFSSHNLCTGLLRKLGLGRLALLNLPSMQKQSIQIRPGGIIFMQ